MENQIKLHILIEVQPGKANQQIALYQRIKPLVLAEQGCLEYELNRVVGSEVKFVLTESWQSKASLAAHDESAHMQEADAISPSFRAGPATVLELTSL